MSGTDLRHRLHQETLWQALVWGIFCGTGTHRLCLLPRRLGRRTGHQGEGRRTERPPRHPRLCQHELFLRQERLYPRSLRPGVLPRTATGEFPQTGFQDGREAHAHHGLAQGNALETPALSGQRYHHLVCPH